MWWRGRGRERVVWGGGWGSEGEADGDDGKGDCDGDDEGDRVTPFTRFPNTFNNRSCPRCVPNRNPFGITRTRPYPNGSEA